ncbi:toprim domain-containing protein [Phototrophicus methaneseepsis]|uniref:Toprim domain-containing protein n=1 Tax=Phototrophicus methaneseepsis TaxID=2710758 RepID=A0A7S8IG62_9CHLR|nr:toprim domain-containing protein [Phototrophicus methaneseepsis]QPC83653.1 toprim domain-containing protein [Phototrophicus methaneseepsis]
MIDVEQLKAYLDCRDLIERDLGQPKYHNDTYSTYKCPLHHEEKGFSLVIYADHWHCFGKCNRGGDAIDWLQAYHGLRFQDACQQLAAGDLPQVQQQKPKQKSKLRSLSEPPNEVWQKAARDVAYLAMETLYSEKGQAAWRYLEEERGLTEKSIVEAGLGYIPGHHKEWKALFGLKVPCGITIPWMTGHTIWGIKVRRAAGQQRYQQVSGGNIRGSLYLADELQPGVPILLTEGEFDALIARQVGKGLISAVALGSAAHKHINPRWFPKFISAPSILICMDDDQAGQRAADQLSKLSQATRCIHVPQGKDINAFYKLAGKDTVKAWADCLF